MWIVKNEFLLVILLIPHFASCQISDDSDSSEQDELILVHFLYRHGDRAPISFFPTDQYQDLSYWPEGLGQLSITGKQQQYELGGFLRRRYIGTGVLGTGEYYPDTIYIQSTDVDRTLMSAECNLAGLFPPSGEQIWNDELIWQPIPVHTVPEEYNAVLEPSKPCPRYSNAFDEYRESKEYTDINNNYTTLFEYLQENSGQPITTIEDVVGLRDTLLVESLRNYTWPDWVTDEVFEIMEKISGFVYSIPTATKELGRLKSGFLLREILQHCTDKSQSKLSPDRSAWMYSAHDITLSGILNTLDIYDYVVPPYASCLMFELYKSSDGTYYIQIYYKFSTNSDEVRLMKLPNCEEKCELQKFYSIYADVIPNKDYDTECTPAPKALNRFTKTKNYEYAERKTVSFWKTFGSV